ncbi:carbonic anhydrase 6-like [Acomys russatus]|uniref:carbonic anhydrase 6-like n=1 Tax=Acomys russatus TaxID=60746 RepID=UPI0021E28E94|nr:carbonic anhydrase 6-like [Acomys russatus]
MRAVVTMVSLFFLGIQALDHWSYSGDYPQLNEWSEKYPTCGGQRQSPIDLQTKKVKYNKSLRAPILVNYEEEELEFPMTNNGHSVQIALPDSMHMIDSDGTTYTAVQMHLHWGGGFPEISGSEHTIDGMRRAMEVHVVHYNANYESFEKAKEQPDGLSVVAFLVEINNYAENTYYSSFISELANVRNPGESTTLKKVNIRNMLPQDIQHYYTYLGSLTTPPCTENVKWFVFQDTTKLSLSQVMKIENSIKDSNNQPLQNNYRETQPLNGRVVEANFQRYALSMGDSPTYPPKSAHVLDSHPH